MTPAALVISGAVPAFALGWFLHDVYDSMKEDRMATPTTRRFRPIESLFNWFGHGNRLIGLCLFCALLAGGAMGYTFTADQQSENRTDRAVSRVVSCIAKYVRDTSEAQTPRTLASVAAQDARRDWDRGYSTAKGARGLTKDELRARYLRLYADYEVARGDNPPLPAFSLDYCQ